MSEQIKVIETPWYMCDYCGYGISGCKTESDVEKFHALLVYRGQKFHFHGTTYPHKNDGEPVAPWDEDKGCMGRWLLAQSHREQGRYMTAHYGKWEHK